MICQSCSTQLPATAKFCNKCGTSVAAAVVEIKEKYCPKCGVANAPEARFCRVDGYAFESVARAVPNPIEVDLPSAQKLPPAPPAAISQPTIRQASIQQPPISPAAPELSCPKCGATNPANAKFCRIDGAPLHGSTSGTVPGRTPNIEQTSSYSPAPAPVPKPVPRPAAVGPMVAPPRPKPGPAPLRSADPVPSNTEYQIDRAIDDQSTSKQKTVMWVSAAITSLILAAAGAFLYWGGYVGNRQGSVAASITSDLAAKGFGSVFVTVDKNWVASVTGSVTGKEQHDGVIAAVRANTNLKGVTDTVQVSLTATELQDKVMKALADQGLRSVAVSVSGANEVTLSGPVDSAEQKQLANQIASGVPEVAKVDDQTTKSRIWNQNELTGFIASNGFQGVQGNFRSDQLAVLTGTVESEDRRAFLVDTVQTTFPGVQVQSNVAVQPTQAETNTRATGSQSGSTPVQSRSEPAPAVPAQPRNVNIRGTWVGSARGALLSYTFNLRITQDIVGQVAGTSVYGTTSSNNALCGGEITLIELTPDRAIFDEKMANGGLLCPGGGLLKLIKSGTSAATFEWSSRKTPEKIRYRGDGQQR